MPPPKPPPEGTGRRPAAGPAPGRRLRARRRPPSLANVRIASTSVFFGKPFVHGMSIALRVRSTRKLPGRRRGMTLCASRRKKSVASTSTRPSVSAATVKPHRIDFAKGVLDRAPLVRVGAVRAEGVVGLHHHHARPDPLELDDASLAGLPAIEPDVVRPQARREAGRVEHLGVELVDLHPERPGLVVPVERHVAVELLEPRRPRVDGLEGSGRLPAPPRPPCAERPVAQTSDSAIAKSDVLRMGAIL